MDSSLPEKKKKQTQNMSHNGWMFSETLKHKNKPLAQVRKKGSKNKNDGIEGPSDY